MTPDRRALLNVLTTPPAAEQPSSAPRTRTRARWPLVLLAAGLCAAAAGVVYFQTSRPTETSAASPPAASSAPAAATPPPARPAAAGKLIASGYVVARRQATIAAETTGRLISVDVVEGQAVEAGALLGQLDDVQARLTRDAAAAALAAAEAGETAIRANLTDARREAARTARLLERGSGAESLAQTAATRVESLAASLQQATAQSNQAKIALAQAEDALARTRITAPFAGIITERNAQAGEIISPISAGGGFTRTGVATLVDMDSLEFEVDVSEANIARVKKDQTGTGVLDAWPDFPIPARVITVIPTANRDKATFRVRVGFDSRDPRILPNMAVKVTFDPPAEATP